MQQPRNRKERRAMGVKTAPKTYTMTQEQLDAMTRKIKDDAIKYSVDMCGAVFLMSLHDKFGFGLVRSERLLDAVNEHFDCVLKDKVQLEEIFNWCREYGFKIGG